MTGAAREKQVPGGGGEKNWGDTLHLWEEHHFGWSFSLSSYQFLGVDMLLELANQNTFLKFFFFFLIMTRREKGQFLSGTGPVSSLFSNLQRKWVWDTRPDQQIEVILESLVPFVPEAKLTYLFFFLTYTFLGLSRLQRKNLFLSKQAWVWFL